MALVDKVLEYIARTFGKKVGSDDSLLGSGLMGSTRIFELVSFLENAFGLKVEDEEIVPEHFETSTMVAVFVDRKRWLACARRPLGEA